MSALQQQPMSRGMRFGAIGANWVHLSIDMQRMFAEATPWHTPWMDRIIPNVVTLTELDPARTVFTRFIPVADPDDARGAWRRYYQRWETMTRNRLDPGLIDLVPALQRFAPPAMVVDKPVLSAWHGGLPVRLNAGGVDTVIISGAETDVCVLATVMGAIDLGYRIILVEDAVCSGADATHDAMLGIYQSRFGMQLETVTTEELLDALGRRN